MNNKTVILLAISLIILFSGMQSSLAKSQYLKDLDEVYGEGSCDTCHVNGSADGPRTPYGTLFENQPNHRSDPAEALKTIGSPSGETQATPESTADTSEQKSPGFGIIASLTGLFVLFLLRNRNK